jgi:hypothetical protein
MDACNEIGQIWQRKLYGGMGGDLMEKSKILFLLFSKAIECKWFLRDFVLLEIFFSSWFCNKKMLPSSLL